MGNKIISFIKKEIVLCIVAVLAIISMIAVPPSAEYIEYIDFHTLALLFSLMTVMAGFSDSGFFTYCARSLLKRTKSVRSVGAVLIMLCFFTSMAVTNDVALITFVPFAIEVLSRANKKHAILITVVLQTVAANLGSMLTPIGNPQNLYLYTLSGMSGGELMMTMLPYTAISLVLICVSLMLIKSERIEKDKSDIGKADIKGVIFCFALFLVCMMTVAGIIGSSVTVAAVLAAVLIFNRKLIAKVDYSLLLTFVGFFILIGNIKNINAVNEWLQSVISGNELITAVVSSQIISNVPAAVLLSGFSDNFKVIMIGADIGGLGTMIASMASLISYKYFVNYMPDKKGRYLAVFTAVNIIFLMFLLGAYAVMN